MCRRELPAGGPARARSYRALGALLGNLFSGLAFDLNPVTLQHLAPLRTIQAAPRGLAALGAIPPVPSDR